MEIKVIQPYSYTAAECLSNSQDGNINFCGIERMLNNGDNTLQSKYYLHYSLIDQNALY